MSYVTIDFINIIKCEKRVFVTYKKGNKVVTFDTYAFDLFDIIHDIYDIDSELRSKKVLEDDSNEC